MQPHPLATFPETKNAPGKAGGTVVLLLAEREGFEPPEAFTSTVFKTAAIDRSAISPETCPAGKGKT